MITESSIEEIVQKYTRNIVPTLGNETLLANQAIRNLEIFLRDLNSKDNPDIIGEYTSNIVQMTGEGTMVSGKLIESLKRVIENVEIHKLGSDIDYSYRGPELKNGTSYTVNEIKDMPVKEFIRLHSGDNYGGQNLAKYFNNVKRHLGREGNTNITAGQVIAFSPEKAPNIRGIANKITSSTNAYLQESYHTSLGTKL